MNNENQLLRPKAVCKLLSISKATLWRWRQQGHFPQPIKLGSRAVGFKVSDINKFINEREELSE